MPSSTLTSPANPLLKEIRRAQQQGSLTDQGWLIAEGPHLVAEAWRSNLRILRAVISEGASLPAGVSADRVIEVSDKIFRSISGTQNPQGVLALVEPNLATFGQILAGAGLVVVLDGVQDPGNAGTIARAAEAFRAAGIVFVKGSVNPFHPKTLRASAGSLFRLPVVLATLDESLSALSGALQMVAGVPQGPGVKSIWDFDFTRPLAIVIGSEGRGVDERFLKTAERVSIPTGEVESLNAAMAAAVLLYEAARQRTCSKAAYEPV